MTKHTSVEKIDTILVPLFVQARQEALREANEIPLNRSGVVTSTPTKVNHLVGEAIKALNAYYLEVFFELIEPDETRTHIETYQGQPVSADFTRNKLRTELRAAAIKKMGGKL